MDKRRKKVQDFNVILDNVPAEKVKAAWDLVEELVFISDTLESLKKEIKEKGVVDLST